VRDLIGLMLQALDGIDDRSPARGFGTEQIELELGRLYTDGSHGGKEVEKLLVAWQETHRKLSQYERREDSPAQ
jgi:hypothetical protein